METINAYPMLNVKRYNLTPADLRTKEQNLYIIVEREHNYYDDSDTNFLYYDADHDCLKVSLSNSTEMKATTEIPRAFRYGLARKRCSPTLAL